MLWLGDSFTLGASVEVELPDEELDELACEPEPDWPSDTQAASAATNAKMKATWTWLFGACHPSRAVVTFIDCISIKPERPVACHASANPDAMISGMWPIHQLSLIHYINRAES